MSYVVINIANNGHEIDDKIHVKSIESNQKLVKLMAREGCMGCEWKGSGRGGVGVCGVRTDRSRSDRRS